MKTIFKFASLFVFLWVQTSNLKAQDLTKNARIANPLTFYVGNPIGYVTKFRIKGEVGLSSNYSLLGCYTRFYGIVSGEHYYLELRKYTDAAQSFKYLKVGGGQSFPESSYRTGGQYILVGAGVGQTIQLNKRFFIQFSEGIKACVPVPLDAELDTAGNGLRGLFYLTGPGAFIDLNINFGYRIIPL
jgi:hypothetical protein